MPKVSVIMPAYNCATRIGSSLDTVFAQRFTDREIIVVNDGSTDDTGEVLRSCGDRIRAITQDNAGPGDARNHGIRLAEGEYIAFLDSDDLWKPSKLAVQVAFMDSHPDVGLCAVNYSEGPTPDVPNTKWPADAENEWRITTEIFPSWVNRFAPLTSAVMVRADLIRQVGGFPKLYYGEDRCAWAKIGALSKWAFHRDVLCHKISHGANLCVLARADTPNIDESWNILRKVAVASGDPREIEAWQKLFYRSTVYFVSMALRGSDYPALRKLITRRSPGLTPRQRLFLKLVKTCPRLTRMILLLKPQDAQE